MVPTANRESLGRTIAGRLGRDEQRLREAWDVSTPVRHCVIDDLLPVEIAEAVFAAFPSAEVLYARSSLRERKRIGVELERYDSLMAEILFAFQQSAVRDVVSRITGLSDLQADPTLYASGLSAMEQGDFLNPHLDNSHDGDQERYRVLNLLYYVTPGWKLENGGNLELWDRGVTQSRTVEARCNRLVLMSTDQSSWHSVNKVLIPGRRTCVSNYYFSQKSNSGSDYRHVTTFTGRPEEGFKRVVLN